VGTYERLLVGYMLPESTSARTSRRVDRQRPTLAPMAEMMLRDQSRAGHLLGGARVADLTDEVGVRDSLTARLSIERQPMVSGLRRPPCQRPYARSLPKRRALWDRTR
jgi:hypothetical protein